MAELTTDEIDIVTGGVRPATIVNVAVVTLMVSAVVIHVAWVIRSVAIMQPRSNFYDL